MPVDLSHSRRYRGGHGSLGTLAVWDCPACGGKNEGRRPEQGCGHCGAGDPAQSKAGTAAPPAAVSEGMDPPHGQPAPSVVPPVQQRVTAAVQPQRILRLIEYLITPGADADDVLRNSLVGRLHFAWGDLTATIVDSVDPNQEDRLRLAKLQPGVWLANPSAVAAQSRHAALMMRPLTEREAQFVSAILPAARDLGERSMTVPSTGPAYDVQTDALAASIVALGGYVLANTLALALGTIAEELSGAEFLDPDAAKQLAQALLDQIPADWEAPQPAPPQAPAPPDPPNEATQAVLDRIREGSKPSTAPWVDPTQGGTKL